MELNLLGGSYQAKYTALNSQRTINWYPVYSSQQEQNAAQVALYPTPGLTNFSTTTLTGTYWRCLFTSYGPTQTRCFTIRDNILYEISSSGVFTNLGTLTSMTVDNTPVYMTVNNNSQLGIYHTSISYSFNLLTNTLTPITDPNFPGNVSYATYLDTYNVVVDSGAVWVSNVGTNTTWTGTQTYTTTFTAAPIIAVGCLKDYLFNFTETSIEPYYADGSSATVYTRMFQSAIYTGIVAKDSLAKSTDGFFFLGKNEQGECAVYYLSNSFGCQMLSPPSITWRLNNLSATPTDSTGYIEYSKTGGIFYYLTVPELNTTFVYDVTTQEWHERQSLNGSSQGVFRGQYYTNFNGTNLFCDAQTGNIVKEDFTNFTEAGSTITRTRISQIFEQGQQLISANELEIVYDPGLVTSSNYNLNFSFSYDGGLTFTTPQAVSLGAPNQYDYRLRLFKLGSGRRWVVQMQLTDPVNLMIQKGIVKGEVASY